jgi:hypothetical protein
MPIPDPLRDEKYGSGGLVQTCSHCRWAGKGHQREFQQCPTCAGALDARLAIVFGGLAVIRYGGDFELRDRQGQSVRIDAADCPEIVQFICRYALDLRGGDPIQDSGSPRQTPYSEHIDRLLWDH